MEWLKKLIAEQLSILVLLNLPYRPSNEVFPSTVKVWIEAFTTALGRADEELDSPRIKAAFKSARPELEVWPMPVHIIQRMPRRPEPKKILYDPAADSVYAKEAFQIALDLAAGRITKGEADKKLKALKGGK